MTYYLADGTECTIERLCREEPLWAASVIPHLTQACDALAADKAKLLAAMDLNERTDAEGEGVGAGERRGSTRQRLLLRQRRGAVGGERRGPGPVREDGEGLGRVAAQVGPRDPL
jgi:hypothetical protein